MLVLVWFGTLFLLRLTSAVCWFPDGATPLQDQPCLPDNLSNGRASFCCGQGFACLSNGICMSTNLTGNHPGDLLRGTCTDKTWTSPDCPNFCLTGGVGLGQCAPPDQTRFCCQGQSDCDCSSGSNALDFFTTYSILTTIGFGAATSAARTSTATPTTILLNNPSSSSTSASTIASSNPSSGSSSTSSSTSSSNPSSSTTVAGAAATNTASGSVQQTSGLNITAVAVGVTVPCVTLLIGLIAVLVYRHHRKKARRPLTMANPAAPPYQEEPKANYAPQGPDDYKTWGGHHEIGSMDRSPGVSELGSYRM